MAELERELRELAAAVSFPETPDLRGSVRTRLPERRPASRWRRPALAVAIVVGTAVVAGLAVPQARTAILDFFGIGAVRVEFVDRLPELEPEIPLDPGERITAAEAPFPLLRSDLLGEPDGVYEREDIVTLLYGEPDAVRLLVTQIPGSRVAPEIVKKVLAWSTTAELVPIRGAPEPGLWIEGEPHVLFVPGAPPRLAANTLLWTSGPLTMRLEGAASREEAVRIAESLR